MGTNRINTSNVQVWREEIHEHVGQKPQVVYYLGWGEDDNLVSDPMPFEELQALHTLIGRVIKQNTAND